jgi:hypothetical protein
LESEPPRLSGRIIAAGSKDCAGTAEITSTTPALQMDADAIRAADLDKVEMANRGAGHVP